MNGICSHCGHPRIDQQVAEQPCTRCGFVEGKRIMRLTLSSTTLEVVKDLIPDFESRKRRVEETIEGLRLDQHYNVPDFIREIWIDLVTIRYSRMDLPLGQTTIFIEDVAAAIWEVLRWMKTST